MAEENAPSRVENEPKESVCDALLIFYTPGRSAEASIKIAIRKGITIPDEFVPMARELSRNGTLGCSDKKYKVSKFFVDPEMKPVPEKPGYEHNPLYPREYPRIIMSPRKTLADSSNRFVHRSKYKLVPNPDYVRVMEHRAAVSKTLKKIPVFNPARRNVFGQANAKSIKATTYVDSFHTRENARVHYLPDMICDTRLENPVNRLNVVLADMEVKECVQNCTSIEFVVEKAGRHAAAKAAEEKERIKQFFNNFDKSAMKASINYHRSHGSQALHSANFKVYRARIEANERKKREQIEFDEMEPVSNDPESDKKAYEEYRKRMIEKEGLESFDTSINAFGVEKMKENMKVILDVNQEISIDPGLSSSDLKITPSPKESDSGAIKVDIPAKDIPSTSAATAPCSSSSSIVPSTSIVNPFKASEMTLPKMGDAIEKTKARRKRHNDWADVILQADGYYKNRSAPHSITSSTSFREDAARLTWDDPTPVPKPVEKPVEVIVKTPEVVVCEEVVTEVEVEETCVIKQLETIDLNEKEPIITSVVEAPKPTKRTLRGRSRTKVIADDSLQSAQPDIVVESTLSAPHPHNFPRPDLEPFVASQPSQMSSFSRPDCEMFMAQTDESNVDAPIEPQFARPRFSADIERVRGSLKAVSIGGKNDKNASNAGSIDTISIDSEGPSSSKRRKTSSSVLNEELVSNLLPPPAGKARPARSRRSFISKNNPKPRHRRTEKLLTDHEQESNSSRNVNNDSDDAISRTSSYSQSQMGNRVAGGKNSCASSRLGDFEDLTWPGRSLTAQQFGDPQPPPEVTIDEDTEAKPSIDELPIPPAINETSRVSIKRKRKEEAENAVKTEVFEEIEGIEVLEVRIKPKEEFDEDCQMVDASYVVPRNNPVPIPEVDVLPPKPKSPPQEELTQYTAMNKHIYNQLNGLFSSDPLQFCKLVLCILEDKNETGKTFLMSAEILDRKSEYSEEFIQFLANSPKDGGLEDLQWKSYSNYTSEFRMKCALPEVLKDGLTPKNFFECVEQVQDMMKRLKANLPSHLISSAEREMMTIAENIVIGRFIMSTLSMASLSNLTWTTNAHIKRRFELLLHGWNEFIRKGGVLRLIVAMDREDVKPASPEFIDICKKILKGCEENVAEASKLLKLNEYEMAVRIATDCLVSEEELQFANGDMKGIETETHKLKCLRCKIANEYFVFFSNEAAFNIHVRLHGFAECPLCFDDCPSEISILLHTINLHFSIRNDYV